MRAKKKKSYKPNTIPHADRLFNIFLGIGLVAYGAIGLVTARLNLSGRRIRFPVLEGGSAWLMSAAFIVGALVLFSVVIDHYDTRDNEKYYKGFRWVASRLGWCLAAAALLSHLYMAFTK